MSERGKPGQRVFGPVPSRRLGYSLGVDPLPFKTCNLDCVYCQLGETTRKTAERGHCVPAEEILAELARVLKTAGKIDCITFSGSGEPTLNLELGAMIRGAKRLSRAPIAVITNGTLLGDRKVAAMLQAADMVLPSLDGATPEVFKTVNRPVPGLSLKKIIDGMVRFRRFYKGKIYLEVMLVRGLNDGPKHLARLKEIIGRIKPDRVDINSPVRPGTLPGARPPAQSVLKSARRLFGRNAQIVAEPPRIARKTSSVRTSEVLALIARRPLTAADLGRSFGLKPADAKRLLDGLARKGRVESSSICGVSYYRCSRP